MSWEKRIYEIAILCFSIINEIYTLPLFKSKNRLKKHYEFSMLSVKVIFPHGAKIGIKPGQNTFMLYLHCNKGNKKFTVSQQF